MIEERAEKRQVEQVHEYLAQKANKYDLSKSLDEIKLSIKTLKHQTDETAELA